jgi:hypothetical protein
MSKKTLSDKNLDKFITDALAIEDEAAKDAGSVGYMARSLIQATLPHSKKTEQEFTRINGNFKLSIMAPKEIGLPYGSIPRLLVAWLTTEAIRTDEQTLLLGDSMADFMQQLDLTRRGGPRGDITRLKDQMMRLFSSSISCLYADQDQGGVKGFRIASEFCWFKPRKPGDPPVWDSKVTLSTEFFNEVMTSSAPVDMRALSVLKPSPMALDIYCWLTYRMSYLTRPTVIPWEAMQMQFGADYGLTRSFKHAFIGHLRAVCMVYPEARVEVLDNGLKLIPSPPHVAKLPKLGG